MPEISAIKYLCSPKKWATVHQNRLRPSSGSAGSIASPEPYRISVVIASQQCFDRFDDHENNWKINNFQFYCRYSWCGSKPSQKFYRFFFYKNIQNHYHQRLILRSLKCIKSTAWLTYLLTWLWAPHTCFIHVFCVFPVWLFSYTVLCELRLFLVSEFGFGVWNHTTAPATMEYLPILLAYPGIYGFYINTRVFTLPQSKNLLPFSL